MKCMGEVMNLFKQKSLWLEYPEDHDINTEIGPKLLFLLGIDWYTYNQRPRYISRYASSTYSIDSNNTQQAYNKILRITFYLTYWQFHVSFKIDKMPYTTQAEYLQWRKHDAKGNN